MKVTISNNCVSLVSAVYAQDIESFSWKNVFRFSCTIATIVIMVWLITSWETLHWVESAGYVVILLGALLLAIINPPFKITTLSLILLTYAWGTHNLLFNGVNGEYDAILIFCIIIAGYAYGQKVGLATTLFTTVTVFLLSHLIVRYPQLLSTTPTTPSDMSILSHTMAFFALGLGYLCMALLIRHLKVVLQEKSEMAAELAKTTADLEHALQRESELAESFRLLLTQEQKKNQNREKLFEEVSHKFRNPLTVISTSSGLLERHADKMPAAKRARYYREIETSVACMASMMDRLNNPAENNVLL